MATLAERIAEESGDAPAEEVMELVLDECECTQLTELTDKYVKLEKLSAAGCGIETLKGFPSLPNLKRLDLSSNNLPDGELGYLKGCMSLTYLLLCGNPMKDLANTLLPLKEHKSLRKLDLTGCEEAEGEDYRKMVFETLDQLIVLDGVDKDGVEDEEDSEVDGEDDDGEGGSEDEDEEVPDDYDEEEDEEGEGDDEENGERGVKRKHEDDEDDA